MMESADKRAGGESVLAKLSELMFIEVVRRHLEALPPEQAGWLAGLRDPFVGKALSLMHGGPARNWTIEELAKDVGLSRSVLAERFANLVGMPPMQYLAKWRMQIASGLLSGGSAIIATVAAEIGYGSEAAFSRAFKKMVGGCHPRPGVAASGMTGRARCCEPSDHPPRILGVESRNIELRLGADFAPTVTLYRLSCSNMLRQQVIRCHCSGQSFALDPGRRTFMGPDPKEAAHVCPKPDLVCRCQLVPRIQCGAGCRSGRTDLFCRGGPGEGRHRASR